MATSVSLRLDTITLRATYADPPHAFTLTPANQSTYPGVLSGPFTITLNWTPTADEVFTLSDNSGGGTLSPGPEVRVKAGATTATFSYGNAAAGVYTITVTDVTEALGSQNVTVLVGGVDELDIRVYDSDNKRLTISPNAIFECGFTVLERGGYAEGYLRALTQWDDLTTIFSGTERVDVWWRGALRYRGYLKLPEREGNEAGEFATPNLYGLMQWLDTIQCKKKYVFAEDTDLAAIAQAIIDDFVLVTDGVTTEPVITSPPLPHDLTTDMDTVGQTARQFDTRGMSVAAALTALCDVVPFSCHWGCGVDATSPIPGDVIYFRPRSTTVAYRPSIGGALASWSQSEDAAGIVNALIVQGGPVSQPNLVTDGSFEDPSPASELVGNLLSDYSFETFPTSAWTGSGGATQKAENAHTGTYSIELDQNNEKIETTSYVSISYLQEYTLLVWARNESGAGPHDLVMTVDGYTSGGASVTSITQTVTLTSTSYKRFTMPVDFSGSPTVAKVKVHLKSTVDTSIGDGINVDDVGLFSGIGNAGWRYSLAGSAVLDYIHWNWTEPLNPWHGAYAVKAKVSGISTSSDYLDIRTDQKARIPLVPNKRYTLLFRYKDVDANDLIKAAVYEYKADGTSAATSVSTAGSNTASGWNSYVYQFTANANTAEAEIAIRVTGNTDAVIDGVMLFEGDYPPDALYLKNYPADPYDTTNPWFYDGDTYQATIATSDVRLDDSTLTGGTAISSEAGASITTYGRHEGRVQNDAVVDEESLLAFAVGYFNAHAVPILQGSVTLLDPPDLVEPDGMVRIINLRLPPDALFPNRMTTTFEAGGFVRQVVDLGSERPDMVEFHRLTEKRAREGFRYGPQ